MRITRIVASSFPVRTNLSNSRRVLREVKITIVAVESDVVCNGRALVGFGFSSFGRPPCETQVRERMAPKVLNAEPQSLLADDGRNFDPVRIAACVSQGEKPAGHAERSSAIGTLDLAVWDLVAKIEDKPLHRVLAERYSGGKIQDRVFCYVGGGYYFPGQTMQDLQDEMRRHQAAGYTQVKMKIGGMTLEQDCARIEAVLKVIGGGSNLAVDANAAFECDAAVARARAIAPYGLRWFEEPCDPLDFESYKTVAQNYAPPLASCECLSGSQGLNNFLLYSGFRPATDIIQLDPPLSYGLTEYLKVIEVAERHGFTRKSLFPHGGNLMGLHIAGGLHLGGCESYPGLFGEFGGFNDEVRIDDGHAILPQSPGLGFESKPDLYPLMQKMLL